jgi:PPOX class probable FMN-dependent enzyme
MEVFMDNVFGLSVDHQITSSDALRTVAEMPSHHVTDKVIDHIDDLAKRFIAASSLAVLSSSRPDGIQDVTPRGDPAGFVQVLSPKLLAIPDRPGNGRMDTFRNLFNNPNLGVIFIIPGHRDTLRVSGKGALVQDKNLGQKLAINGRSAELTLLINVEKVMCHCPKAFVRGKVWQSGDWPDTSDVPSLAEMMVAHGKLSETIEEMDAIVVRDGKNNLY